MEPRCQFLRYHDMKLAPTSFTIAFAIVATTATMLIAAGCLRYGGTDGLLRRVEVELAQFEPHDSTVPTPAPQIANNSLQRVSELTTTTSAAADSDLVTLLPTATPTPEALPATAVSSPQSPPLQPPSFQSPSFQSPPFVELTGLHHEWQTWNNCGPATLSFYLSYYGSQLTQADTGSQLRHHEDDKNVSPDELADFARNNGYAATVRVNGTQALMKAFLSNGIPVIIETWLEEEPNDGMGHYRLLTGYDDENENGEGYWIAYDSYISEGLLNPQGDYRGIRLDYAETEALWKVFNRTYLVVYPPEKHDLVMAIFGEALSEPMKSEVAAMEQAKADIAANPQDAYAWFNLGSMLLNFNNPQEAADAFDEARRLGLPWRMLWYQYGPFAAYYEMGRFQEVIDLTDATMRNVNTIEELYYWKGMALAALGNRDSAQQQWTTALSMNPTFVPAQQALNQ